MARTAELTDAKSLTITLEQKAFVALQKQAEREQRSIAFLIRRAINRSFVEDAEYKAPPLRQFGRPDAAGTKRR